MKKQKNIMLIINVFVCFSETYLSDLKSIYNISTKINHVSMSDLQKVGGPPRIDW